MCIINNSDITNLEVKICRKELKPICLNSHVFIGYLVYIRKLKDSGGHTDIVKLIRK